MRRQQAERRDHAARLRDGEERAAEHRRARARPSSSRRPPGRASSRSVATRAITAVAASTPQTIRIATPSGLPQCAPSTKCVATASTVMLTIPSTRLVRSLPTEHRAPADRRGEHPRERPVAALVEHARDAELDREEEEEDRHPGRVERPGSSSLRLVETSAIVDRARGAAARCGQAARLGRARRPAAATATRTPSTPPAKLCASERATSAPIGSSTLPSTRSSAGRPPATAAEKPAGITNVGRDLAAVGVPRGPRRAIGSVRTRARPCRSTGASTSATNARAAGPRSWSTSANENVTCRSRRRAG